MVKFNLKAVPVISISRNHAQGSISFCADACILKCLLVDYQAAQFIFLILAGLQKPVPVIHNNINRMHPGSIKQSLFIAHPVRDCHNAKLSGIGKYSRQHQNKSHHGTADFINMPVRCHNLHLPFFLKNT